MTEAHLVPVAPEDVGTLAALAGTIWRQHYADIISPEQIEYMLAGRFAEANLARYADAAACGLVLLRIAGVAAGYCSWAPAPAPAELKLEQLYLLREYRGRGLGRLMLGHVEWQARAAGRSVLCLSVNRRNRGAIGFYRRAGFAVRAQACVDIGAGYVMDDYIMAKAL